MGIIGELWVKLGLKNKDLNKGLDESKEQVNRFSSAIGKVGGMIAAAFSAKAVVEFANKAADLANKVQGVRQAFNNLGAPGLLNDLRRATRGTVDDLQLMQRAVQARNFNIPVKELAGYLEFATQRARETGQSVDYLVDSIITGLGRQSVMILDNLGISAKEIRDNMKGGASMAEAVGKIISESMAGASKSMDEASLSAEKLTASWTNFLIAFGEGSGVKEAFNWIKTGLANKLDEAAKIFSSDRISKFGKFQYLANLGTSGWMFKEALRKDAEEAAKALADAEEYGPPAPAGLGAGSGEAAEKAKENISGLVNILKEQISALEEIRDLTYSPEEAQALNAEIAAMEERLKLLQMTADEARKYRNEQAGELADMSKYSKLYDINTLGENIKTGRDMLDEAAEQHIAKQIQLNQEAQRQNAYLTEAVGMMNNALMAGITGGLDELARAIAGVEGANVGSVLRAILSPLADACIAAGLLIMTTGEGIEALKTSLISFFGGNAIAAGAALVAIGTAAKVGLAAIGKNAAKGGGAAPSSPAGYSGGYAPAGAAGYMYDRQSQQSRLVAEVHGQDLLFVLEKAENQRRR